MKKIPAIWKFKKMIFNENQIVINKMKMRIEIEIEKNRFVGKFSLVKLATPSLTKEPLLTPETCGKREGRQTLNKNAFPVFRNQCKLYCFAVL